MKTEARAEETDRPRRHRAIYLFSLLALFVGLPALAFFLLTDLPTLAKIWALERMAGHEPTASSKLLGIFSSHIVVPVVWCALAFVGVTLDSRRPWRIIARAFLGVSLLWGMSLVIILART